MKAYPIICAIFLAVVLFEVEVNAEELPQRQTFDEDTHAPAIPERADRHRRVTCDLLSVNTPWGSLGHAACAAHCLAMMKGYRGGYCDSQAVCVCRK